MKQSREQFLDDCRFAKVVDTFDGSGILIGGNVYRLLGPFAMTDMAEWFVDAFRSGSEMSAAPVHPEEFFAGQQWTDEERQRLERRA